MKIVRVRISGWAIRRGNEWMFKPLSGFFAWTEDQADAFVFTRLSEAEQWVQKNSKG